MKCFALRRDGDLESLVLLANSKDGEVKLDGPFVLLILEVGCWLSIGFRLLCPSVHFVLVPAKRVDVFCS